MSDILTFTNCTYAYIKNDPYKYPTKYDGQTTPVKTSTGWHIIPNQQYSDWLTPKQWFELMYKANSFALMSCSVTVQNMIPLTQNAAIQGTASFTAFNNTIYALGYTDNAYETVWREEDKLTLWEREGVTYNGTGAPTRYMIPQYDHVSWNFEDIPNKAGYQSYFWDPLTLSEDLLELRPGKNAIKFSYTTDKEIFYNTSMQQAFDPTWNPATGTHKSASYGLSNEPTNNYKTDNITPHNAVNAYINTQDDHPFCDTANPRVSSQAPWNHIAIQKPTLRSHSQPCPQWFIKMIPIFDENGALIQTTAQVCMYRKISFKITPKKNAINMPLYPQMTKEVNTSFNYISDVCKNSGWLSASAGVTGKYQDAPPTAENE